MAGSGIDGDTLGPNRERVYFYVPRTHLASVMKLGYLSARAQCDFLGTVDTRKYERQEEAAYANYPDYRALVDRERPLLLKERILRYLDWRCEHTGHGASAVYFLFAPVPSDPDIQQFVEGFLEDRVLLSTVVPTSRVFSVPENAMPSLADRHSTDYWRRVWRAEIARASESSASSSLSERLWFEGIPHGYVVPRRGRITARNITVEDIPKPVENWALNIKPATNESAGVLDSVHALERESDTTPPVLADDLICGAALSGAHRSQRGDSCVLDVDLRKSRVAGLGGQPEEGEPHVKRIVLQDGEVGMCNISLGVFSVSVSGARYSFDLRKRCSGGEDGWWKRKSELVVDRGADWPLVAIDYSGYFYPPEHAHKRVIYFAAASAPKQDDPVHAIRPLPLKGALRVLVPIGVQLCEYFFGGMPITLQDDASIGDGPLLSTLKLLTGTSAYSTYGIYGFYIPEIDQLRLNKLSRYYATYSVNQTLDILLARKDAETLAFFDFGHCAGYCMSEEEASRKIADVESHKNRFDKYWGLILQAPCGFTAADLDVHITEFCAKLCAAGDTLPPEFELVTVSRRKEEERVNICYGAYGELAAIIANFKWIRTHTLDRTLWEHYATLAQVSPVIYAEKAAVGRIECVREPGAALTGAPGTFSTLGAAGSTSARGDSPAGKAPPAVVTLQAVLETVGRKGQTTADEVAKALGTDKSSVNKLLYAAHTKKLPGLAQHPPAANSQKPVWSYVDATPLSAAPGPAPPASTPAPAPVFVPVVPVPVPVPVPTPVPVPAPTRLAVPTPAPAPLPVPLPSPPQVPAALPRTSHGPSGVLDVMPLLLAPPVRTAQQALALGNAVARSALPGHHPAYSFAFLPTRIMRSLRGSVNTATHIMRLSETWAVRAPDDELRNEILLLVAMVNNPKCRGRLTVTMMASVGARAPRYDFAPEARGPSAKPSMRSVVDQPYVRTDDEARTIAQSMILQRLGAQWRFVVDKTATRRAGACNHQTKTIHMAGEYARKVSLEEFSDVMLHEIAHALVPGHKHDAMWRAQALLIGCSSLRCTGVIFDARSKNSQRHLASMRMKAATEARAEEDAEKEVEDDTDDDDGDDDHCLTLAP